MINWHNLFEASLTYIDSTTQTYDGSYRGKVLNNFSPSENLYFLDIASLTIWEDQSVDYLESQYIYGIGKDLGFSEKEIARALEEIASFFEKNSKIIPFLKDHNLAFKFYESMSKIVKKLIIQKQ